MLVIKLFATGLAFPLSILKVSLYLVLRFDDAPLIIWVLNVL